jgi:hypothetical protein
VIGGEVGVDLVMGLAELERGVAAVVGRQLLLDDVGLDRRADVVRLTREIGGLVSRPSRS